MKRRQSRQNSSIRRLIFESLEDRRLLAPVTVSNLSDVVNGTWTTGIPGLISNPGGDGISLREAILAANSGGGADTIDFSTNPAHGLNGGTITLTQGELTINDSVSIDASMLTNGLTIDANDPTTNPLDGNRVFNITDPTSGTNPPLVTLTGLTLTGADENSRGGAIRTTAPLTVVVSVP